MSKVRAGKQPEMEHLRSRSHGHGRSSSMAQIEKTKMSVTNQPDRQEIALKAAQRLTEAGEQLRLALAEVDAAVVFSNYALYRMAAEQGDRPSKHIRPALAGVELAAWMLYPEF